MIEINTFQYISNRVIYLFISQLFIGVLTRQRYRYIFNRKTYIEHIQSRLWYEEYADQKFGNKTITIWQVY